MEDLSLVLLRTLSIRRKLGLKRCLRHGRCLSRRGRPLRFLVRLRTSPCRFRTIKAMALRIELHCPVDLETNRVNDTRYGRTVSFIATQILPILPSSWRRFADAA